MRPNTAETFWANVDQTPLATSCWLWKLGLGRGGYGKCRFQGRTWSTHRLAWTLAYGKIPNGKQINHSCDNRLCCNPAHLEAGTQKTNIEHAVLLGRMASGDRQGLRKHPDKAPKGERNGSAKLTESDVLQILRSSESGTRLAARYGVSNGAIYFIRRRRTWKHVKSGAM